MTTNDPQSLAWAADAVTRALIAATQRRLDEALAIKSPAELGIKPDRSKNGKRRPGSIRHRAIR